MAEAKRAAHSRHDVLEAAPGLAAAEMLFDSLNDVLFCVKDRALRYVAANTAFVRAAGLSSLNDLLGRSAAELFPPALAAGYGQQDDDVFATGTAVHNRMEMITRPDGAIGWFMSQKVAVRSAAGEIVALAGISRDLSTPAESGGALSPLAETIAVLQKNFAKPMRVMSLARKADLSVSQYERKVRELTGLTPRQILTKARIEAAAAALRDSEQPLKRIALDCGFYDQATFSRQFHAATGATPSEYRRAFHAK